MLILVVAIYYLLWLIPLLADSCVCVCVNFFKEKIKSYGRFAQSIRLLFGSHVMLIEAVATLCGYVFIGQIVSW